MPARIAAGCHAVRLTRHADLKTSVTSQAPTGSATMPTDGGFTGP